VSTHSSTADTIEVGGRRTLRVRPAERPDGGVRGTVVHLHGGGYGAGEPARGLAMSARLADATGTEWLLPSYRLAPQHPFPAAVEDALAVYRAVLEDGVAPERLVVMGLSAGGGLTMATLLAAREAGLPRPAAAVCLSPWFDLTVSAAAYERCAATDAVLTLDILRGAAERYLAGTDPRTPLASPLFADDEALAWLPPVLVHASSDEVLADDATSFAERLGAVGGDCTLRTWPGAAHCWHLNVPEAPGSVEAVADVAEFLRARLPLPVTA
jgi:acetyl esterase/lipase